MYKIEYEFTLNNHLNIYTYLGEAVEQDETFWGDGIWGESDDESFSEEVCISI
jgi:hypothetical protein